MKAANSLTPSPTTVRQLILAAAVIYMFISTGIYTLPGSVNEWLHLTANGWKGSPYGGTYSYSPATSWLARAIGVDTPEAWRTMVIMGGLSAILVFFGILYRQATTNLQFLLLLATFCASQIPRSVLNGQADYDFLVFLGLICVLSANTWPVSALGGLILGLTNPELAALALAGLGLIYLAVDRSRLARLAVAIATLFPSAALMQYLLRNETVASRTSKVYLDELTNWSRLVDYLPHFFAGAIASFLVVVVHQCYAKKWFALSATFLATFLLPAIAFQVTSDGIRVFALVSFPALFAVTSHTTLHIKRRLLMAVVIGVVTVQVWYEITDQKTFEPHYTTMYENVQLPSPAQG